MTFVPLRTRVAMTIVFALVLGAGALLPFAAGPDSEREVLLRVRNMAFYAANDSTSANPVIKVTAGERIRLTLINDDPGFSHDFAIGAWDVRTPLLRGEGRTSVILRVPEKPGNFIYVCTLHAAMMKGTIEVVPAEAASSLGN